MDFAQYIEKHLLKILYRDIKVTTHSYVGIEKNSSIEKETYGKYRKIIEKFL